MKVSEIKPEILQKISRNVITSAAIHEKGISFHVTVRIHIQQCEVSGLSATQSFPTYDEALAAVQKWMANVRKKYKCREFGRYRTYDDGFGWCNYIANTRGNKGLPIYASAVISPGVDWNDIQNPTRISVERGRDCEIIERAAA